MSSLCNYSDAFTGYIGSIYSYIGKINNTQIDNAKDLDVVMLMYNLLEYSDNYSKTSGILW